jgi:hypothetical protein
LSTERGDNKLEVQQLREEIQELKKAFQAECNKSAYQARSVSRWTGSSSHAFEGLVLTKI